MFKTVRFKIDLKVPQVMSLAFIKATVGTLISDASAFLPVGVYLVSVTLEDRTNAAPEIETGNKVTIHPPTPTLDG